MAQRTREPVAERSTSNEGGRERILAAALQAFAFRGYDGASTAEIARAAGVTQPLIHYHFASKEALWKAAVSAAMAQTMQPLVDAAAAADGVDGPERLRILIRRFVHITATAPELARIISYEGAQGGERLAWILRQPTSQGTASFLEELRRGMAEGWLRPLPPEHVGSALLAAAAYCFMVPASMRSLYDLDVTDPAVVAAHADTVAELFVRGLTPDEDLT